MDIVTKGLLPVQFTLIWAAVSLLPYSFLCFAHLYCLQNVPLCIRLPLFFKANVTEPEETKAQEPRQSDTLCPFLSFLTRLSPLSRLELILCEWMEICVDVCALNPKIWRGREGRGMASRGGPCDWPCPSPVELWTPAYTYSKHTHVYWIYRPSEQYNTVPFFV